DTLAFYTRALINALGLGGQLTYAGGGSALGIRAAITARTDDPSQRVNPASRFVNDTEIAQAAANDLRFVDYVLGLDAVVIHVNNAGNPALTRMAFSDAGKSGNAMRRTGVKCRGRTGPTVSSSSPETSFPEPPTTSSAGSVDSTRRRRILGGTIIPASTFAVATDARRSSA